MFGLGTPELFVIMGIAFLVFGGKKLPELGAGLGKGIKAFKGGLREVEDSVPGLKEVKSVQSEIKETLDVTSHLKG